MPSACCLRDALHFPDEQCHHFCLKDSLSPISHSYLAVEPHSTFKTHLPALSWFPHLEYPMHATVTEPISLGCTCFLSVSRKLHEDRKMSLVYLYTHSAWHMVWQWVNYVLIKILWSQLFGYFILLHSNYDFLSSYSMPSTVLQNRLCSLVWDRNCDKPGDQCCDRRMRQAVDTEEASIQFGSENWSPCWVFFFFN